MTHSRIFPIARPIRRIMLGSAIVVLLIASLDVSSAEARRRRFRSRSALYDYVQRRPERQAAYRPVSVSAASMGVERIRDSNPPSARRQPAAMATIPITRPLPPVGISHAQADRLIASRHDGKSYDRIVRDLGTSPDRIGADGVMVFHVQGTNHVVGGVEIMPATRKVTVDLNTGFARQHNQGGGSKK